MFVTAKLCKNYDEHYLYMDLYANKNNVGSDVAKVNQDIIYTHIQTETPKTINIYIYMHKQKDLLLECLIARLPRCHRKHILLLFLNESSDTDTDAIPRRHENDT